MDTIDVAVLTKNSEKTLPTILDEIVEKIPVNQLIIVDGCSTDHTVRIAKDYADQILTENQGVGYARQIALRQITTPLMAYIDSDLTHIQRDWYHRISPHFNDPATAWVCGVPVFGAGTPPLEKLSQYHVARRKPFITLSNTMLRTEAVRKIGGFKHLCSAEDNDLKTRLEYAGYRCFTEYGVKVIHPRSILENIRHNQWYARGAARRGIPLRKACLHPLLALREAATLALRVHPTFLVLTPLKGILWLDSYAKELKQ